MSVEDSESRRFELNNTFRGVFIRSILVQHPARSAFFSFVFQSSVFLMKIVLTASGTEYYDGYL